MLADILEDLRSANQLITISEEVDPELVMSAIQFLLYQRKGPAVLFQKVKGSKYPAIANVFGTIERSKYLFRKNWDKVERTIALRNDPMKALKNPLAHISTGIAAINALPKKVSWSKNEFDEIQIEDLPMIKHWPLDGGAFVTLPQVFSIDPDKGGIMNSNLGMYRVQLNGNQYKLNEEVGLHYQIHRGIGVHHTKAIRKGEPLKVSIFIGGHPAHTLSAVMPLPEGLSEIVFGGLLAGRRFRYAEDPLGNIVSMDADFVITGEIHPNDVKPEGPFGDHLGYYSLVHDFPVMKVKKVYAKKDAIWPFTVVGRPPQEDTSFGDLIHELTGGAIKQELPGIKEVYAVDAAGVHPLLLAIGSERYTPFLNNPQPAELLTQSNHILGTGQLSLAKYLIIVAPIDHEENVSAYKEETFFHYFLERVNWERDLHFQTQTTIDTLDYTGGSLNEGSKVVMAAHGPKIRNLKTELNGDLGFKSNVVTDGILGIQVSQDQDVNELIKELEMLKGDLKGFPLIILTENSEFLAADFSNFLWVTFTRSNPATDVYGLNEFIKNKHWGCSGALIIDARIKSYMPPALEMPDEIWQKAEAILAKYWKQ